MSAEGRNDPELLLLLQTMNQRIANVENSINSLSERVAKHEAWFKVLSVLATVSLGGIISILVAIALRFIGL